MKKRVCVLTAGHLSTTPRMVKVADALSEEGYDVSVVSAQFLDWADEADRSMIASRWANWRWTSVDYRRHGALPRYFYSGIRTRAAQRFVRLRGVDHVGISSGGRARERIFPELASIAVTTRPAMIYGGGSALAATAVAAQRAGVPFALDLEDFHSTQESPAGLAGLTENIERQILPAAAMLTSGSRGIADAYRKAYGVNTIPIHNVFPLPVNEPTERKWDGCLRLYWFGQTIGPGRGIEDAINALALADIKADLTLRGRASNDYLMSLRELVRDTSPKLELNHLAPAAPDDMVDLCRPYDAGIAMETGERYDQSVALSNKALTYILAGLAVAMNDTPGQHQLGTDMGEGAILCPPGNIEALAAGFKRWFGDRELLSRAKQASWNAAKTRWHWEHPEERGAVVAAVARVMG
jgi:hypothetical protein